MQMPFVLTRSRVIMLGAVALVVLFIILLFAGVIPGLRLKPGAPASVKLTVWGVFDSRQVFDDLINLYRKAHSNVEISYEQKNPDTYEADLIGALAAGTGPDIFMFQNTWLPKHKDKITPVSTTTLPYATFRAAFPQVVSEQFAPNQIIYASPLYLDTLALFYNKDMFDKNSIPLPPKTWTEFTADVNKLKQINPTTNEILRAGAAIGGSNQSINRGTDILNLLMLQAGTQMVDPGFQNATFAQTAGNGEQAGLNSLNYYSAFANPSSPSYTWNENLHYSVDNFAEGNTAMMFNYSHQIPIIHNKNPFLNFGIAPAPLESGCENTQPPTCVSYANYWGLAVSKRSRNPAWAWDFIINTTITNKAAAESYFTATKKPPALISLINDNINDPDYGVFIKQALIARSWPQIDNNVVDKSFSDMIQAVITGRLSSIDAIKKAEDEITQLMQKNQ